MMHVLSYTQQLKTKTPFLTIVILKIKVEIRYLTFIAHSATPRSDATIFRAIG